MTKAIALVMAMVWLWAGTAEAGNITKADNSTVLSTASSWTGSVLPTASDNAVFNGTIITTSSATIGTGLSVHGLIISNTGISFTIAKKTTNTLTIGAGGIDMSSANNGTNDFTISAATALGAAQAFNVASGRTLTVSGTLDTGGYDLTLAGAGTLTLSGVVSGSGNLIMAGNGGVATLAGADTYTGNTTVRAGTLQVSASAPSGAAGRLGNSTTAVQLGDSGTLGTDDLALIISDTNGGTNVGRDINVNNYGNSTTIGSLNTTGSNTFSGNLTLSKDVTLSTVSGGTLVMSGNIAGTANITINGGGLVDFKGTNDANMGNVTISAGTLAVYGGSAIGDNSAVNIANVATLSVNATETVGSLAGAGNVTLSNSAVLTSGGNNNDTTFSGVIQGGNAKSGLTKIGSGTLTLTNTNTFTGNTTVSGGVLQLGDGSNIGSVGGNIINNAGLTFDNGGAQTYSGVVSGTGNLSMTGGATMTLTGNNSFTGTTTVSAGTLSLAGTGSNKALGGTTTITVNTGGTLLLGASNQINTSAGLVLNGGTFNAGGFSEGTSATAGLGALTLTANSTLNLGGSSSTVAFSDSSSASWTTGDTLQIVDWSPTDQVYFGTTSSGLTAAQISEIVFINPNGDGINWNAAIMSDGLITPVPEPSTYLAGLMLVILAALGEWRRRRQLALS